MDDREAELAYTDIVRVAGDLSLHVGSVFEFLRERNPGVFGWAWDSFSNDARAWLLSIMDETPHPLLCRILQCRGRALNRVSDELEDLLYDVINDLLSYQIFEHKLDQIQRVFARCRVHGVSTATGLRVVEDRLWKLWRASSKDTDTAFRQHLNEAREVFELFVGRYRVHYRFGEFTACAAA